MKNKILMLCASLGALALASCQTTGIGVSASVNADGTFSINASYTPPITNPAPPAVDIEIPMVSQ